MSHDNDPRQNYKTPSNLTTRAGFVTRYGTRNWFGFIRDHVGEIDGNVLDIGCGVGWIWQAARDVWSVDHLTLFDQSDAMLQTAQDRLDSIYPISEVNGDAISLPFADDAFDAVFAMHVMYHVTDIQRALREVRRVLKPGGKFIVTTVGDHDLAEISEISRRILGSAGSDIVERAFGSNAASAYLQDAFPLTRHYPFVDEFHVDDVDSITTYLASFPPANTASAQQMIDLRRAFEQAMGEDKMLITERRQSLFIAKQGAT